MLYVYILLCRSNFSPISLVSLEDSKRAQRFSFEEIHTRVEYFLEIIFNHFAIFLRVLNFLVIKVSLSLSRGSSEFVISLKN